MMNFRRDIWLVVALTWTLTGCGADPASSGGNQGTSRPVTEKAFTLPGGATLTTVWVDPGSFTMGSPSSEPLRDSNEGPQHQVTISKGFYLGKYEVTQRQWESVMNTRPWSGQPSVVDNPDHPAVHLSWEDTQAFIQKINAAETAPVYRLPTEAEWEFACRAGSGSRWSFGDQESRLRDYAWYDANALNAGEDYAHRVGAKQANPWGLHDMHGNIAEWTLDQHDPDYYKQFVSTLAASPWNKATKPYPHVARGGSWDDEPEQLRSAARRASDRSWKQQDPQLPKSIWYLTDAQFIGFRVIRPLKVPPPEELSKYWTSGVEKD